MILKLSSIYTMTGNSPLYVWFNNFPTAHVLRSWASLWWLASPKSDWVQRALGCTKHNSCFTCKWCHSQFPNSINFKFRNMGSSWRSSQGNINHIIRLLRHRSRGQSCSCTSWKIIINGARVEISVNTFARWTLRGKATIFFLSCRELHICLSRAFVIHVWGMS